MSSRSALRPAVVSLWLAQISNHLGITNKTAGRILATRTAARNCARDRSLAHILEHGT